MTYDSRVDSLNELKNLGLVYARTQVLIATAKESAST